MKEFNCLFIQLTVNVKDRKIINRKENSKGCIEGKIQTVQQIKPGDWKRLSMRLQMNCPQLSYSIQGDSNEDYKEYNILKGWQTPLLEVEKNYYCFYKKCRNRVLINLCQKISLRQLLNRFIATNKIL